MLLVPATMELLGDDNWWMPAWLDRIIPKLDVDGSAHDAAPADDDHAPVLEPTGPTREPGRPIAPAV